MYRKVWGFKSPPNHLHLGVQMQYDRFKYQLTPEWDPEVSKGIFGKRSYFHGLLSSPEDIAVVVQEYPQRGYRVLISPPDYPEADMIRWGICTEISPEILAAQKKLGDHCYFGWLIHKISSHYSARAWVKENIPNAVVW